MTVNEGLVAYTEANGFIFPQKHKMIIGALVAKSFREEYGMNYEIPTIMSAEETGTFQVFDYPNHFRFHIEELIHEYVIRLKKSKPKNKNEKPLIKSKGTPPISYSSDPPPKKERKRRPIITSQPAFSGKMLKKK